jgi:hypothetical protein
MRRPQGGFEIPSGIATLAAGTVTVGNVDFGAGDQIMYARDTDDGNAGYLECPVATRNAAAGTFVITSDNGAETSTIMWCILPRDFRHCFGGQILPSGIATLGAGGTVTVPAIDFEAGDLIMHWKDTPAGAAGWLECPIATRLDAAGTFVINSSNAGDTSTVGWTIIPVD